MKKLFPAICMTLLAAALLGTSTFAWFSMNTQVSATGMQVTAKTDNTYLLISSDETAADRIQLQSKTTVNLEVGEAESKVYPCAPVLDVKGIGYTALKYYTLTDSSPESSDYYKTAAEYALLPEDQKANYTEHNNLKVGGQPVQTEGVIIEDKTTAETVTNWYTANAAAPGASTIQADTARQLTAFDGYVIQRTVYLTVAAGANPANNLTVTPKFAQKPSGSDISAAKVFVTTSDNGFAMFGNDKNETAVDIKGDNNNLTDQGVLTVNIYIYYDGNDTNVFTNNAAELTGATIELRFDVTAVPGT